ncbi:MAG TPA: RimK/LysX family protein [Gammaproteobacteria bacterium]|nr:RimK/LysX family protein [Gammaproteobacteria bacterium]
MGHLIQGTVVAAVMLLAGAALAADQTVVGWVEQVRIYPGALSVRAKVDTGAKTSSLNCDCIQTFQREGKPWVRFTVTNTQGRSTSLERPVVREVIIKRHYGREQKRPVIRLGLCMAGVYKQTDVNLVDRSGFNYQMLIGRRFLQQDFIVNPSRTFLTKPACPDGAGRR